ncbi:facilitated trehalose transporter Tret1-like isoform X1 [Macrobrachium nipponense]|uniref:facilitated trehalose transporter Tret1-like isoform X1 n=1 Tax=Macrobrachium nipponense TaxID=159736 RepID=UPI0030C816B3
MLGNGLTPRRRQVFATSSVGMILMGMMTSWGFPSASLPQMEQPDSEIHFTAEAASWFATVPFLMLIPGSFIGSSAYEWAGPRRTFLIVSLILCCSIMSMSLASWSLVQEAGMAETLLLASRVVQGSAVAFLIPFVSVYTYEISDQYLRGTLTSITEAFATGGFVLCYLAGCFLSWRTSAIVLPLVTLVPGFIGVFLSHESPLWLARIGKEEQASEILSVMRCTEEEASSDLKTARRDVDKTPKCSESLQMLSKKSNALAVVLSSSLMIMKEITGFAVLSIYVVHIFQEAGVGLDPKWSSVIVGVARLACNVIGSFMLHNFRRRLIFVVGNTLTGLATATIGAFFYLQSQGWDISHLTWLPLTALVVHMVGYAGGVGPCTWTASVEVLPGPVRSIGTGIFSTSYATAAFIISKSYPDIRNMIGLHGVFWMFSGGCVGYILLAIFFLPETKGKSLQDIEDYWENVTKKRNARVYV